MANISQEVWYENLEKLEDGTYKRKNQIAKAKNGTTLDEHLVESAQQAHLAKNIGLEDTEGNFVATELEGAMTELFTNVSDGKALVGGAITDVDDSVVIPTEPTFQDLANAIGGISTGKKWAEGVAPAMPVKYFEYASNTSSQGMPNVTVVGLDFKPTYVILFSEYSYYRYLSVFSENTDSFYPKTVKVFRTTGTSASETVRNFKGDKLPANVTENGFTLPVYESVKDYGWVAFE